MINKIDLNIIASTIPSSKAKEEHKIDAAAWVTAVEEGGGNDCDGCIHKLKNAKAELGFN